MSRKKSREKAMEILFGMELSKDTPAEALEIFEDNYEGNIKEIDLDYIKQVINGVWNRKTDIDSIIEANLQNWKIGRISKVNLVILRMGIFEMKYIDEVPDRVALNEALELTKMYSDEKSVSFINGVLDKVLEK